MRSLQKATRIVTCSIYRDGAGLEVRVGYSELDLLRSERVGDVAAGCELAERWRQAVIGKGGFEDVVLL
jgi:hypothetical protein